MAEIGKYDLEKLKDCRHIYLRNPPKFMHMLVFMIIAMIIGAAVYATVTIKTEEIQSAGVISDIDPHRITQEVGGIVTSVSVKEGDQVSAGDVLFSMDSSSVENERQNYVVALDNTTKRLALTVKFIDALDRDSQNPFLNNEEQQQFYQKWLAYENQMSFIEKSKDESEALRLNYLKSLTAEKEGLEKEVRDSKVYEEKVQINEKRISDCERFIDAMLYDRDNPFSTEEGEFYHLYQLYKGVYDNLDDAQKISYKDSRLSSMYGNINSAKTENMSYGPQLTSAALAEENLQYVLVMIDSLQRGSLVNPFVKLPGNDLEMKYYDAFNQYIDQVGHLALEDQREQTYLTYQSEMQQTKTTLEDQITSLKQSISSAEQAIQRYTVTAISDGKVHFDELPKVGTPVPAGQILGTINSGAGLQIEVYVPAHDRTKLEVGFDCRFTIDGLMQSDYGSIKGKIAAIQNDATITEMGSIFKVTVLFDDRYIVDKDGNQTAIIGGMSVRLWIIYEKLTYMDYLLEGMGL